MSQSPPAIGALRSLDRLVHEPARLAMLTVLASAEEVEFKFLLQATGLTKGNLSRHAVKLEEAGYVSVTKRFRRRIPVTSFRITAKGRKALTRYWETMRDLRPVSEPNPRS